MRKLFTGLVAFLVSLNSIAQRDSVHLHIYFSSGVSTLNEKATQTLDSLSGALKSVSIKKIVLNGHADDVGPDISNMKLSEARTEAVRDYMLITVDASKTAVILHSYGEKSPATTDRTEAGRALNRRVDIVVEYEVLPSPPEEIERSSMTIDDLYDRLKQPPQLFCIDNTRDTMLVAKHGTLVYIRANSIQLPRGYACDPCIIVEVKEALYKSDILKENLSTVSANGDIMVSQSMVSVKFKCDNSPLPLTEGSDYVVLAPTDSIVNAAGIFEGGWNDTDDHFDWHAADDAGIHSFPNRPRNCNEQDSTTVDKQENCSQCAFFFCGMGKWIGGWFNKEKRAEAKKYTSCRKEFRKKQAELKQRQKLADRQKIQGKQSAEATAALEGLYGKNNNTPAWRDTSLVRSRQPGLDTISDPCKRLRAALRALDLPDSTELKKMLQKSIDNMKANGNPVDLTDLDKLQYYAYSINFPGWSNIDWMLKAPDSELKPITVNLTPSEYTQCKLIFKKQRTVLPPQKKGTSYVFPLIPRNYEAWLLIINTKTGKGRIEVELRDIVTGRNEIDPKMKEMSINEFVQLLNIINGK